MASLLLALIYVCFVSLGLPDSLLGSAWPVLHSEINVPLSYAGIISITIFLGTILSSLFSDRLLRQFGAGKVTAISTAITAISLFGFSLSRHFWALILWSVPYGLGAGAVDAILNNYVALHYKAKHMIWLHCAWGVGASISPYVMSYALLQFNSWNDGYFIVSLIQAALTVVIVITLPLWARAEMAESTPKKPTPPLPFRTIFQTRGAVPCFFAFFFYCALELTTSLWASSYLIERWNFPEESAAGFASMFYIGITFGRFINGFFATKFGDHFLIQTGSGIVAVGIALFFIPFHPVFSLIGFVLAGLGCAPIYPCILHITPKIFGKEKSQAMIGVQMAFAYTGFLIMPPLFGFLADWFSTSLLPVFLMFLLILTFLMYQLVAKATNAEMK